jgi:hypothetical protein
MVKKDIAVSLFSNIKAVNYPSHVSLMEILRKIGDCDKSIKRIVDVVSKEKDKSKRDDLKQKLLPVFCPNGTFEKREDKALIEMSGIVCIDLDNVKDLQGEKNRLKTYPCVLSVFKSPSQNGLKVLVLHDLKDPDRFYDMYFFLGEQLGLTGRADLIFDTSCAHVSRACFMSVDKDIYINDSAIAYHVDIDTLPQSISKPIAKQGNKKDNSGCATVLTDSAEIRKRILEEHELFEKYYSMQKGNRNCNLFILASFFKDSGIPEQFAEDYLVIYYLDSANGFTTEEIKRTVQSAYNTRNLEEQG